MPRKIIIDTDPGVDDVLAILLALASPEVEVALITLVFGNTHAINTRDNLLKMYYQLAREREAHPGAKERYPLANRTVVAVGEDAPIGGEKHVATYFHGRDGLSNISETNPEFTPPAGTEYPLEISQKSARDEILQLLASEPEGSVTIVALGPLTNVAHAYRADKATFARIGEVVWMGGALDVPGNTSPVAEFNSFADPYAFDMLRLAAKAGEFSFVFAPLDITARHTVPFPDLLHEGGTPLEAFTTAFLLRVRGLQKRFGLPDAMEMHDPVAVWYAVENAPGTTSAEWEVTGREFGVERSGEITRGMCVVDRRGTGETEGKKRTEDEGLLNDIPMPATKAQASETHFPKPEANVSPNGEAEAEDEPEKSKALPKAITRTPGSAALRVKLLSRVFGATV
ncbi:nucleoside hydrolase [Cutaneotrichosporon oleaginosum]|uniref:Nucleoside hydrolase n=1 Tax=Cutaneotrichosporon oleaginosum TaxID=879819 RepID=A0A0J0XBB9_9TREE|nr:nucleoside hydrolase [Cutaneotrichosporon oleaginosum]KLT38363.1 nucleoside hydrolase [Cutaneotrichosporon oleaginosum]